MLWAFFYYSILQITIMKYNWAIFERVRDKVKKGDKLVQLVMGDVVENRHSTRREDFHIGLDIVKGYIGSSRISEGHRNRFPTTSTSIHILNEDQQGQQEVDYKIIRNSTHSALRIFNGNVIFGSSTLFCIDPRTHWFSELVSLGKRKKKKIKNSKLHTLPDKFKSRDRSRWWVSNDTDSFKLFKSGGVHALIEANTKLTCVDRVELCERVCSFSIRSDSDMVNSIWRGTAGRIHFLLQSVKWDLVVTDSKLVEETAKILNIKVMVNSGSFEETPDHISERVRLQSGEDENILILLGTNRERAIQVRERLSEYKTMACTVFHFPVKYDNKVS